MAESKQYASSPIATLLGDVVDSRHHPDRRQLHQRIQAALETAADSALREPLVESLGAACEASERAVKDSTQQRFPLAHERFG